MMPSERKLVMFGSQIFHHICWFVLIDLVLSHPLFVTENVIVKTHSGRVKGFRQNVMGTDVNVFLGIPYALPPVGSLRFRKPASVKPWEGVYPATRHPLPCVQVRMNRTSGPWMTKNKNFSEDCLYLNIWSPAPLNGTLKPVMVWIHGGGFLTGSIDVKYYDGRVLAAYGDVVIVSMNYRLGLFGFLNADIEEAPGNMGLHDQVLALRWIKDNVAFFGGDPQQITLFGHSVGGMSVGFHMLSPLSRNLFKRAILQSGAPTLPSFFESVEKSIQRSDSIAKLAGCSNEEHSLLDEPRRVVQCLRRLSLDQLVQVQTNIQENFDVLFFPRWEDDFLPENPHISLRNGDVGPQKDILVGTVQDEGSFFLYSFFPSQFPRDSDLKPLTKEKAMNVSSQFFHYLELQHTPFFRQFFVDLEDDSNTYGLSKALYDSIGDFMFLCPSVYFSEKLQQIGRNVHYYQFTYRPPVSQWPEWMGVVHFDDIPYVFGSPLLFPQEYTSKDAAFSKRIMDVWLTFAKTGKASVQREQKWPIYDIQSHLYMKLHPDNATIGVGPHERNCNFWRIIFELAV